jgi:mRNA interferase MazF
VNRGEVRLVRFPALDKERPVVILTRQTSLRHLTRVTVAPITSTIRGVDSEVVLTSEDGMKHPCAVNLHNVMTLAQRVIGRSVGQLSATRMREICRAMHFALGCDS